MQLSGPVIMGIEINPLTLEGRVHAADMAAIISALEAAKEAYRDGDDRERFAHMELLQVRLSEGNPALMRRAAEDDYELSDVMDDETIETIERVR